MVSVELDLPCSAALACSVIAADDRSSPLALLIGAIGVSTLPVGIALTLNVAPFDAAFMRAELLLPEGRYRLVILDLVSLAAILANLASNSALPFRVIFARPELGAPLAAALIRAKPEGFGSPRYYRLLLFTPFTLDDDGHSPSYYKHGPQVKA
jgi:hypothetical protein